jgi:alkylation response protein AidB-like acyl-CoA dehydrogenase
MLPIRQPGLDVHRIEMLNGSREFCQEFLTDVRVPDSDRVGAVDDGWTVGTRWMFHERMLHSSPLISRPAGNGHSDNGATFTWAVARDAGRVDEPGARDRIGEARMLDLVERELHRRIGEGLAAGTMADQSAAIGRLFGGLASARVKTLAFEIAGSAGAAWTDDDGEVSFSGSDFLMRQVSCIGGGTTEMARNVISERVLGMPRERSLDKDVPFRDIPRSASTRP